MSASISILVGAVALVAPVALYYEVHPNGRYENSDWYDNPPAPTPGHTHQPPTNRGGFNVYDGSGRPSGAGPSIQAPPVVIQPAPGFARPGTQAPRQAPYTPYTTYPPYDPPQGRAPNHTSGYPPGYGPRYVPFDPPNQAMPYQPQANPGQGPFQSEDR